MKLLKNIGHNFFAQIIVFMSWFILVPYLTRNLGADGYGRIAFFLLLQKSIFLLIDAYRPVLVTVFNTTRESEKEPDYHVTSQVITLLLSVLFVLLTFLLLSICNGGNLGKYSILYISISIFLYFNSSYNYATICALGKIGIANIIRASGSAISYILFIFLSFFKSELLYYAAIFTSVQLLIYLIYKFYYIYIMKISFGKGKISGTIIKNIVYKYANNILFNCSFLFSTYTDRFFVYKLYPLNMFGIYSVNYEIGSHTNFFSINISNALFPFLAERGNKRIDVFEIFALLLKLTLFLLLILITPMAVYSDFLISLYAGEPFSQYSYILNIILSGVIISCLGFFGFSLSMAEGNFKTPWLCYFFGSMLMLALGYPVIAKLGVTGAALLYLTGRISDIMVCYFATRTHDILKNAYARSICYLLFIMPVFVAVVFFCKSIYFLLIALGYFSIMHWLFCLNESERDKILQLRSLIKML